MTATRIHTAPGLVDVNHRPDLRAVYLKWHSEYDAGTRVRDAVHAALAFVRAHDVPHWVVDVSTSPDALSEADYAWVSSAAFRDAILASPLRRFVLRPPGPETGQDTAWVAEWEASTLSKFGDRITARVCPTEAAMRDFLVGSTGD
ncbi:hypothetical protein [Roseovarius aestuariivivens]|uniref:hypothetical protein n=1 Tax=Roseovarius aestuariivivens TaxID=1888910 RepID=UPI001436B284|nr:hypothetical protein [Roseovarius aestuariivivens]